MQNILFIPTHTYLSEPVFKRLVPYFDDYNTYYINIEEQFRSEPTSSDFKNLFSKTIKLSLNIRKRNSLYTLFQIFKFYNFQNQIISFIKEIRPVGVITTSDLSLSIRIIKKVFPDIPIFVIQPALFTNNTFPISMFQKVKHFIFNNALNLNIIQKQNHFANEYQDVFLLLWGEYFKSLVNKKHSQDKIKIIGDITLDSFPIETSQSARKEFLKSYNFDNNSKIVTICTGAYGNLVSDSILSELYEIYKQIIINYNSLFFIIKPHPREKINKLITFVKESNLNNVTISNEPLHELFKYTDIHISSFSRTAVEAVASNIPIVTVNPQHKITLHDFFNNELNESAQNIDEALHKIDVIVKNANDSYDTLRKKYIKKIFCKIDGNATKRAVNFIKEELLKQ